jgi:hypothetical protein
MGKRLLLVTCIIVSLASTIAGQTEKSEATGTLLGIVVREDTNEPIADVRVAIGKGNTNAQLMLSRAQEERNKNARNSEAVSRLFQMTADSLAGSDTGREFNTVTDKNGRFAFEGIPTGAYPVSAEREGFVNINNTEPPTLAHATAAVTARQTTEITLKLLPGSVISGRILDSNGEAMPNATIEVFRRMDIDETSPLEPLTQRSSDDRGEYRVFQVPPGEYLLSATPASNSQPTKISKRTFYPSTADVSAATRLKLAPGDDLRGVNIQIQAGPEVNAPQSDRHNR